jgi:prepilin-type N-terminal cleavage/methylation domain-containing protein
VHVSRGMTLVELVAVVAIAGVVASAGMASMAQLIEAEKGRNEALRFSTQLRRLRAEAMQQQQYTLISVTSDGDDAEDGGRPGVQVTYQTRRLGSLTSNPCEEMFAGNDDTVKTVTFSTLDVAMATGAEGIVSQVCLDPYGIPKPVDDVAVATTLAIDVTIDKVPALTVSVDAVGAIASSDQPIASGIAQTSYFPLDLMDAESAKAPPNLDPNNTPALPAYEIAPGEFVDASGAPAGDGSLGGDDDPCAYDPQLCPPPDPCILDPLACDPVIPEVPSP